jgi:hypothetical protein
MTCYPLRHSHIVWAGCIIVRQLHKTLWEFITALSESYLKDHHWYIPSHSCRQWSAIKTQWLLHKILSGLRSCLSDLCWRIAYWYIFCNVEAWDITMRVSEMRLYYTKLSPSFIHVTSNLKNATKDKSLYCTCLIDNLILSDSVVKS